MRIRSEVLSSLAVVLALGTALALLWPAPGIALAGVLSGYLLYFFRDPSRSPPSDPDAVLSGADGRIMSVTPVTESTYLKTDCVRISIFLSLFDVHVNRAPIAGASTFCGYFPGKHLFTFTEKSSDVNQHNTILITGARTRCLVNQIVGPVARRVIYWLDHDRPVTVSAGASFGMMKFGSRMDIYLPAADVTVTVRPGDIVRAGETIVARITVPASERAS